MTRRKNVLTKGRKAAADRFALDGRLDEAAALFARVCNADPTDVEAWVKLSDARRRLGRHAEAESCARRALLLAPNLFLAHHTLGVALQCQGRLGEAIDAYRHAVELRPEYPDAHYLLGNALLAAGQVRRAESALRHALALRPGWFEALSDLGAVLLALGRLDEAESCIRDALRLQPGNAEALSNLATLIERDGRVAEALALHAQAARLRPDSPEVLARQADLLEKTGDLGAARDCVARGLALASGHATLNLVAARLDRRGGDLAAAAARLEPLLDRPLAHDLGSEVHLLLGQLHDRLGNTERVLPHLLEGKRLAASATDPEGGARARFLGRVAAARRWLTGPAPQTASGEEAPVFLVGFPRSGTTLLEQVLDSHPGLQTVEEKPMAAAVEHEFLGIAGDTADALAALTADDVARLREVYWAELAHHLERRNGARVVDKLPLNLVRVPLLWRVFPEAQFILAVRHPCDVVLSCLMQGFGHNDAMAGLVSLEGVAEVYAAVMGGWCEDAERLPLRWHRIRYEDLVADFEPEVRRLLAFLDLEWDDAVLEHTRHARERTLIRTPSYHQVTQPIYLHARYRWERYARDFGPVMPKLRPFMEVFGYADAGRASDAPLAPASPG